MALIKYLLKWDDKYLLGIPQFDEHHHHLVRLLNKTYKEFTTADPEESLGGILEELADYASYHFAAEEDWMKENSYPRLMEHSKEHETFTRRVAEIQKNVAQGTGNSSLEIIAFLKDWLTHHILNVDTEYRDHVAGKGKAGSVS